MKSDHDRLTARFVGVIRRYRFWMKLHGVGGWAWWLAMLWVGIGAAASGLIFLSSTQPVTASNVDGVPAWLGGPGSANVIVTGGMLAIAAWLVLTIPVLVSGLARLPAAGQPLWVGAWVVGPPLMILTRVWLDNLPERTACGADGCGVVPYYGPPVMNWRELAICGAFLALGAAMTWILAGSEAFSRRELSRHGRFAMGDKLGDNRGT